MDIVRKIGKRIVKERKNIFLYGFFCFFMIMTLWTKANLHIDETYTFGLSNNVYNNIVQMSINEGEKYEDSGTPWKEYMAVEKGHRFDYANVWINQKNDVHPPLYYVLVHTISSFFAGKYSLWYAGIINIIFAMLTLYVVRKLVFEMTSDKYLVNAISVFFIISACILNTIAFLRMYVMTMFLVTFITYLFIKELNGRYSFKYWITVGVVTVIGALTHYYYIVYLFFLCIILGIYFLISKKWKEIRNFLITMIVSGGISVVVFPAMLSHIFGKGDEGYRGQQSLGNLQDASLEAFWERIVVFYNFVNSQIFGGYLKHLVVIALFISVTFWLTKDVVEKIDEEKRSFSKESVFKWLLLIIPSVCYFILVSKMAVYLSERYQQPIYALLIIWIVSCLYIGIKRVVAVPYQKVVLSIVLVSMTISGWKACPWDNLWRSSEKMLKVAESYSDLDCLYIYESNWRVQQSYYEIEKYNSVTFLKENNLDLISGLEFVDNSEFVVYIVNEYDKQSVLNTIMSKCPLINKSEELGSFGYATAYRLYGQDLISANYKIYDYDHKKMLGSTGAEARANVCLVEEETNIKNVILKDSELGTLYCNGLALDISGAIYKAGTNIQLFNANNSDAQKWRLKQNADGSYIIFSVKQNLVLAHDDSGNILLSEYVEGNKNQIWWFECFE